MSARRMIAAFALLSVVAGAAKAEVAVVVELIPDNPGPYAGGEALTVDVWLHSEVSEDVRLELIQFDFAVTDPRLSLAPTFTFDYSSIPDDFGYQERHPELPVPWTANWLECVCPELFLPLPAGGSLHIGSVVLQLPSQVGVYRLDALNADEPDDALGARLHLYLSSQIWAAFTGEMTGGSFDFVVGNPPIPTLSGWALIATALLLLAVGSWVIARRTYGI